MKVMFILHEANADKGSWKSVWPLLKGLRGLGVELLVVLPERGGAYELLQREGIQAEVVKYVWDNRKVHPTLRERLEAAPRSLRRTIIDRGWMKRVRKAALAFRPDLIHSNSSVIDCGYRLAQSLGVPHVWHIREYGDLDFGLRLASQKRHLAKSRHNICITRGVAAHHGLDCHSGTRVIYDAVCSEDEIKTPQPKEMYFLYAGALIKGKGIGDLLVAWSRFCKSGEYGGEKLKVCGGRPREVAYWSAYAERIGAGGVEWMGSVPDVAPYMQRALATVVPSQFEGFGRVMPEAMANGSPVIARDRAGSKEQLDNGLRVTGREIGCRYSDEEGLVACMGDIASGKTDTAGMTAAAQEALRSLYLAENYAAEVKKYYEEVLEEENNIKKD